MTTPVNNNATNPTYLNYQKEYQTATANAQKAKTAYEGTYQGLTSDQWTQIANNDKIQLQAAGVPLTSDGPTGANLLPALQQFNAGSGNSGFLNEGNQNTGSGNTGNQNTGSSNLGSANTGNFNTGNENTGSFNSGIGNTGNANVGNYNTINGITGSNNADTSTILSAFQGTHVNGADGKPISLQDQNKLATSVSNYVGQNQHPTYNDVLKGVQNSGVALTTADQTKVANAIAPAYGLNADASGQSSNITTSQALQGFQASHINHADGTAISLEDQQKVGVAVSTALAGKPNPTYNDVVKAVESSSIPNISAASVQVAAKSIAQAVGIKDIPA